MRSKPISVRKFSNRLSGLVQVYTGDGKGKTTAAFGLALRAAGAGLKVGIFQFIKGPRHSESTIFKSIDNITIKQCGIGRFIKGRPSPADIDAAHKGFREVRDSMVSGRYDVVILDEVNSALGADLINTDEIKQLITDKPSSVELVLTGRGYPKSLYKYADLITYMKKVKHPFDHGIMARKGIEY